MTNISIDITDHILALFLGGTAEVREDCVPLGPALLDELLDLRREPPDWLHEGF